MPNRILRDWTDSEPVSSLSPQGERTFVRIIMKADDFGRLTGSAKLLRPLLYPLLLDQVREADLERWIAECVKSGLVRRYDVEGKQYIHILKFGQIPRATTSKYPIPPPDDAQVHSTCAADAAHVRPYADANANAETKGAAAAAVSGWRTAKGVEFPEVLRTEPFSDAWNLWESHLRKKRVRTTDLADREQLAKCVAWGLPFAVECIRHSVAGSYQGLFEPRRTRAPAGGDRPQVPRGSVTKTIVHGDVE